VVLFVFAVLVLTGAQGCMVGAGRQRQRSPDAQRVFGLLFSACAAGNFVVAFVAWVSHDRLAEAIALVAGALLVFGAFRWTRSVGAVR
jgi:hypothetical protein